MKGTCKVAPLERASKRATSTSSTVTTKDSPCSQAWIHTQESCCESEQEEQEEETEVGATSSRSEKICVECVRSTKWVSHRVEKGLVSLANWLWNATKYVSPSLETNRQYQSIHMSVLFVILQSIACVMMLGYTGLMLQATSWSARALIQLPLSLCSGLLNVFMLAESLVVERKLIHTLAFSIVFAGAGFFCMITEQPKQVGPVAGALTLIMTVAQLPFARNKRLGCSVGFWAVFLPGSLVYLAMEFNALNNQLSVELHGFLLAFIVTLWEAIGLMSATIMWRWFYSPEVAKEVYFALVAATVQSAEALRLVSLLGSAFRHDQIVEEWSILVRRVVAFSSLSVLLELASRSLIFVGLLCSVFSHRVNVSPEMDAILRSKFVFSYTPYLVLVFTLPVSASLGKTWILSWTVPLILLVAIIPEIFTDALMVLLYMCKRRERFFVQLKLLQHPEAHGVLMPRIFDFHDIYGGGSEQQHAAEVNVVHVSRKHVKQAEVRASSRHCVWICLLAVWNYVIVASSLIGIIGQCNFNVSGAICDRGNESL
eukprot:TRINITY_DN6754_c0_g2_i1.p1 TRINITY_DN6754_c0_g2~~TRINITY_DN6754_c0_g2_i1.p1  ORF type:complete len:542 (+),score=44.49 TRINITY_DN6754_c0_g2_i1:127-1752(+)